MRKLMALITIFVLAACKNDSHVQVDFNENTPTITIPEASPQDIVARMQMLHLVKMLRLSMAAKIQNESNSSEE